MDDEDYETGTTGLTPEELLPWACRGMLFAIVCTALAMFVAAMCCVVILGL